MKIERIGDIKTVMCNEGSRHNYFGWPTVCRLQNGKIASVASGFRLDHVCPFGKAVIAYSEDEGETFTAPAPVIDTVLDDRDGGVTFGPLHISPVTSPHGPMALSDGRVVWVGRLYDTKSLSAEEAEIVAYEMTETGEMRRIGEIARIPGLCSCEPHMAEAADGTLITHIRVQEGGGISGEHALPYISPNPTTAEKRGRSRIGSYLLLAALPHIFSVPPTEGLSQPTATGKLPMAFA